MKEVFKMFRTYEAIEKVSNSIIHDNLCEAILVKGSIGRGDDDAYSDVDLYVIVQEEKMSQFLDKRVHYLESYKKVVFYEYVNFVAEQVVAIYDDCLHIDLYTVTIDKLPHNDKAKVIYDPNHILDDYCAKVQLTTPEELAERFSSALYYIVEAESAYQRKNYPWTSYILSNSIANCAVLLRYLYDEDYAYLGLKKNNEILPSKQYLWLEEASKNLTESGYPLALYKIIKILEFVTNHIHKDIRDLFHLDFFNWMKEKLENQLFQQSSDEESE